MLRRCFEIDEGGRLNPNVAKVRGLQRKGIKGEDVVILLRALDNAASEVPALSCKVKNITQNQTVEFTPGDIQDYGEYPI